MKSAAPENTVGILHVLWSLGVGGAEKLANDMIRMLPRDVYRPVVCSVAEAGFLGDRLRDDGYHVYHRECVPGVDMGMVRWLREIISHENIRIIHAHQYSPMYYSVLAALGNKQLKLVYTEHGRLFPDRRNWKRYLVNPLLAKRIDHMVSIAESTKKAMIHYDNLPGKKIRVVHNGVEMPEKPVNLNLENKRMELGIPAACRILGTAARLDEDKNLPMMLRAFKIVLGCYPDSCLLIAGCGSLEGSKESDLKALATGLGIEQQVKFIGQRDDLQEIYPLIDVFLLSSYTEGISISLLEAMVCGLPCVVTDVGGNSEVVLDGVTGFLVPSDAHESMADKVLSLLADPELVAVMGNNGSERVASCFSFSRMMDEYLELYES